MRFEIAVRRLPDDPTLPHEGWQADVRGITTDAVGARVAAPIGTRIMRRVSAPGVLGVPLPPEAAAAALPRVARHQALCTADSPSVANDLLARIAQRTSVVGELEAVGRWLFESLLGPTLWNAMLAADPGSTPLELVLAWRADAIELSRLPWELMYGPGGFLSVHPDRAVAIVRTPLPAEPPAVAPPPGPLTTIAIRPRVLFIVGASLDDPAIQAGAEYLGLIRRLRMQNAVMASRVLLDATPQQVKDVVASFLPSIVHVITHGRLDADGRGRLMFFSDEVRGQSEEKTAEQFLEMLGTGATRPPIIVLNACETAGAVDDRLPTLSTPLAAELIGAGVRLTVGHTGRVTDRACRLFTRRFYEALLQGEPLGLAVAEGRRTARAFGADPATSIDWALPALLMAPDTDPVPTILEQARVRQIAERASRCLTINNPAAFCGRVECVDEFGAMLYDRSAMPVRVLAYEVAERDAEVASPRYGKTRLLQELASHAVREGLIPVSVSFIPGSDKPKNALAIAVEILRALRAARTEFGLPEMAAGDHAVLRLKQWTDNRLAVTDLPPEVQDELLLQTGAPRVTPLMVRAALRRDLVQLVTDARTIGGQQPPVAPVVVLIDDVHEFNDGARELLEQLLTVDGLGAPGQPVPVVLAYTGGVVAGESATAAQAITTFFESGKAYARRIHLRAFSGPVEDRLAYRQFLLHHSTPLVVGAQEQIVYDLLKGQIRGVPSRLEISTTQNSDVRATLLAIEQLGAAVPARDEDALAELRGTH